MGNRQTPVPKPATVLPLKESEPPPEPIIEAVRYEARQAISDYDEEVEFAVIITSGGVDLYVRGESGESFFCSLSEGDVLHAGVFTFEGMEKGELAPYRAVARTEVTGLLISPDTLKDKRVSYAQRQSRAVLALHALATAIGRSLEIRLQHRQDEELFDQAVDAERDKRGAAEAALVQANSKIRRLELEKETLMKRLAEIEQTLQESEAGQAWVEVTDEQGVRSWRPPPPPTKNPPKGG